MSTTMDTTAPPTRRETWVRRAGYALSALPVLMLLMSATMKLSHAPQFAAQWTSKLGYPLGALTGIGALELFCAVVYVIPRTSMLGAILMTGYLGGAIATHVRIGDPGGALPAIMLAAFAWAGLVLRGKTRGALWPERGVPVRA